MPPDICDLRGNIDYASFVKKAISCDERNVFKPYDGSLDTVPEELKAFYRDNNPVDVEIDNNGIAVRFYTAEDSTSLQDEYSYLSAQFVFAACNGDPIFLKEGYVHTRSHGVEATE